MLWSSKKNNNKDFIPWIKCWLQVYRTLHAFSFSCSTSLSFWAFHCLNFSESSLICLMSCVRWFFMPWENKKSNAFWFGQLWRTCDTSQTEHRRSSVPKQCTRERLRWVEKDGYAHILGTNTVGMSLHVLLLVNIRKHYKHQCTNIYKKYYNAWTDTVCVSTGSYSNKIDPMLMPWQWQLALVLYFLFIFDLEVEIYNIVVRGLWWGDAADKKHYLF